MYVSEQGAQIPGKDADIVSMEFFSSGMLTISLKLSPLRQYAWGQSAHVQLAVHV